MASCPLVSSLRAHFSFTKMHWKMNFTFCSPVPGFYLWRMDEIATFFFHGIHFCSLDSISVSFPLKRLKRVRCELVVIEFTARSKSIEPFNKKETLGMGQVATANKVRTCFQVSVKSMFHRCRDWSTTKSALEIPHRLWFRQQGILDKWRSRAIPGQCACSHWSRWKAGSENPQFWPRFGADFFFWDRNSGILGNQKFKFKCLESFCNLPRSMVTHAYSITAPEMFI